MRLRQIALVAHNLEPVAAQLNAVFGLNIAFRDPAVGVFGLVNAVMPVGGEFLEIVQPVTADASAGRYLKRRGGDAGYMLIFEVPDAMAHRARLEGQGVRIIAQHNTPQYTFTHFHPGDFGGVLTSIDTAGDGSSWRDRFSDWPPAGGHWREALAPSDIGGIVALRSRPAIRKLQRAAGQTFCRLSWRAPRCGWTTRSSALSHRSIRMEPALWVSMLP